MTETTKTNNCNKRETLVSYLYNEATADETRAVETHLNECAFCGSEMEAFGRVRDMLQHWQLEDLPVVRVAVERKRSAMEVLKELFGVMPVWVKAFSAVAAAMLVLSVMGTEVSIGKGGFSVRTGLFRTRGPAQAGVNSGSDPSDVALSRSEVRNIVNQMIIESERQQQTVLNEQLVKLHSELDGMHTSDLVKLTARLQEQRDRLRALERDIDRREGLDLSDILFSDAGRVHKNSGSESETGTQQ